MLSKGHFGVYTFVAKWAAETDGANGLPATPASIRILGRFQALTELRHPHICRYLDLQRASGDRVFVVSECYPESLELLLNDSARLPCSVVHNYIVQIASALAFLHSSSINHGRLAAETVLIRCERNVCKRLDERDIARFRTLFQSQPTVRLAQYGLAYMTDGGRDVDFPIGLPWYSAPEILFTDGSVASLVGSATADIWSLGVLMLELCFNVRLQAVWKIRQMLGILTSITRKDNVRSAGPALIEALKVAVPSASAAPDIGDVLLLLIDECLCFDPRLRPSATEILKRADPNSCGERTNGLGSRPSDVCLRHVFDVQMRPLGQSPCVSELKNGILGDLSWLDDASSLRPIDELYYLWKLAGNDVAAILKRRRIAQRAPPVTTLPKLAVSEGEIFGNEDSRKYVTDLSLIQLSSDNLSHRLGQLAADRFFISLELQYGADGTATAGEVSSAYLPVVVKERDVEYQLERMLLFHRLVACYPFKLALLWREARVDVPPLYRSLVWAALLGVRGDASAVFGRVDTLTPTATDRQIDVDIPRCHQYDELMSSPAAHAKLKRILKAWIVSHPEYVYWQGLDSLCAPFLYLNFNNEALAYASIFNFIPRYVHKFFLKDNSAVIQEYLAVFNQLIAFHDPELYIHLRDADFNPELYAIPWFLTMFAHVMPLHKLFYLWDTLLLGDSSFPLFVGVSILLQLRDRLMLYGFNECILLFSDLPQIDTERCVNDSVRLCCRTPKSATYRQHAPPPPATAAAVARGGTFSEYSPPTADAAAPTATVRPAVTMTARRPPQELQPLSVAELRDRCNARLSGRELRLLLATHSRAARSDADAEAANFKTLLCVDIRSSEEYIRGALPGSVNLPADSLLVDAETAVVQLPPSAAAETLFRHRGNSIIVLLGNVERRVIEFGEQLVKLGYSRVCVLEKGLESIRSELQTALV